MSVLACFRLPTPVNIMARSSSITNSFANAIIPVIYPTEEEVVECLRILNLTADDLRCAYCGDKSTEWDHLRPVIKNRRPTGYISEIANLVPACGKCNQSKGNKNWLMWINSTARLSPRTRGIAGLEERIERLKTYEAWRDVQPIDIKALVGEDTWRIYWEKWDALFQAMQDAQCMAEQIKATIAANHQHREYEA